MKQNTKARRESGGGMRGVVALVALALAAAALVGLFVAYDRLRDMWREQCVATDMESQVSITEGRLVRADVVAEAFGLKNGVNLAEIDFAARRAEMLGKYPAIREISVTRRLPNRVEIAVVEREPAVRMGTSGRKGGSGLVADEEGVVFGCRRGTNLLPIVKESPAPGAGTPVGQRLSGRSLAALRLVMACREPRFQDLRLLEVDVSKSDYLVATLADYSTANVSWPGMDDSGGGKEKLAETIESFLKALRCDTSRGTRVWNVFGPDRVYANTMERIVP